MKIGIVTSGNENLSLFTFLTRYDHEYLIYYDFLHWPYGDKLFHQSLSFVEEGIDYLVQQGAEIVVVSPVYELALFQKKKYSSCILPLFTTYLLEYCFRYSLVGKIGLIGDFADIQHIQSLIRTVEDQYCLSSHQQHTKKFHFPFAYWCKEVPFWKYYLQSFSYSHILVNKIIKFDLRYFKDAMVDTLVPLQYGYFHYQRTITKFLNFKKIRFHKLEILEKIFQGLVSSQDNYSVTVFSTSHNEFIKREKRILWLLQRGKSIDVVRRFV